MFKVELTLCLSSQSRTKLFANPQTPELKQFLSSLHD